VARARKPIRIGCSGWNYQHWREWPYEGKAPSHWLDLYTRMFDTVELNVTFYRLVKPKTAEKWVNETPEGFVFAAKASRYLTHIKKLTDLGQGVERYYDSIEPLAKSPKLGPVVWQLPGWFKRDDERLEATLAALPGGRHCFEFRHESWFRDEVYEILRRHRAALVIGDTPERPFQSHELTADWTLIRFHYGRRGRGGNYSDRELDEWAERIDGWARKVEVFGYFNNDWEGHAVHNARWLKQRLS
jgi:uncharacterized protein YecE (DUF72 family)